MDGVFNHFKSHAASLDQAIGQPRFGLVSSVDPTQATARVLLQPENVLTGWLPLMSPLTGAGWGIFCPPSPGDQVLVIPQEGDAEHGIIVGSCFSFQKQAPAGVAVGEIWMVHASGAFLRIRNDGSIEASALTFRLQGDVRVDGDVYDRHGSLSELRDHYNAHQHSVGGALTSTPTPQD